MKQRVVLAAASKSKQRSLVKKSLWVAKTPSKGPNTAQCQKLVYQRSHFTTEKKGDSWGIFQTLCAFQAEDQLLLLLLHDI